MLETVVNVLRLTSWQSLQRQIMGEVRATCCAKERDLPKARLAYRLPTPLAPMGYPLAWVKQVVWFPEDKMNELRGLDATLYIRFLRGCCACRS